MNRRRTGSTPGHVLFFASLIAAIGLFLTPVFAPLGLTGLGYALAAITTLVVGLILTYLVDYMVGKPPTLPAWGDDHGR